MVLFICYYISISRDELLMKLLTVMGINAEILYRHPDSSYVLTADNTKKMMAILMRFRCIHISKLFKCYQ